MNVFHATLIDKGCLSIWAENIEKSIDYLM